MHPENGVKTSDAKAFGRNYFNRPSGPETEDDEFADERAEILAEMKLLKKHAVDYMHPEVGVQTNDGAAFGRNYFNRPSAPEVDNDSSAGEIAEILAETKMLKKLAVDYMHPENGVKTSDGAVFGRNYFSRPSAPETESNEMANERAKIMAEMTSLKRLSVDFMHPENGVKVSDGSIFGRNYFNRSTAPEPEEQDIAHERAEILSDKSTLRKYAADYMHPEVGVKTSDGTAFGRNYFGPDGNAVYSESTAPAEAAPNNAAVAHEAESRASSNVFDFDEDFAEMRATFSTYVPTNNSSQVDTKQQALNKTSDDEEEGNLSRSPSSVMLFALWQDNNNVY
jgi:hypothetical protein